MTNKDFYTIWGAALAAPDQEAFVAEWATSIVWGDQENLTDDDMIRIADYCGKLWDAAHMSVRQIKDAVSMTQAQFAERFCIPKRTVENWCVAGGKESRNCPDYIRLMMLEALGIVCRP